MKKTKLAKSKVKIPNKSTGKKEVYWKITVPRLGKGRTRRFFKDETDADTFLEQQQVQLINYGIAGATMRESVRSEALLSTDILGPLGLSLLDASKHYAEHIKYQKEGITLSSAVDMFRTSRDIKSIAEIRQTKADKRAVADEKRKERQRQRRLKQKLGEDYIPPAVSKQTVEKTDENEKVENDYSPLHQKGVARRIEQFHQAFEGRNIREISPLEIEAFLNAEKLKAKKKKKNGVETVYSLRRTLSSFYNFLIEMKEIDHNPIRKGKKEKGSLVVKILNPSQCASLLRCADAYTIPSLAIAMFCGLRASEIGRLDWSNIKLDQSRITLDTSVAVKVNTRRVVPIHPTCEAWLRLYPKTSGKVVPIGFRKFIDRVKVKAGFKPSYDKKNDKVLKELLELSLSNKEELESWDRNCLRHSAITYALAESQNAGVVATWAGTSEGVIKEHYDAQASEDEAKAFYALTPAKVMGEPANS